MSTLLSSLENQLLHLGHLSVRKVSVPSRHPSFKDTTRLHLTQLRLFYRSYRFGAKLTKAQRLCPILFLPYRQKIGSWLGRASSHLSSTHEQAPIIALARSFEQRLDLQISKSFLFHQVFLAFDQLKVVQRTTNILPTIWLDLVDLPYSLNGCPSKCSFSSAAAR